MRRKIIVYVLLFVNIILFRAQAGLGEIQQKQLVPFPTSAEAYSLSKVEKMPMDYFRGKANINIPIYTINSGGINIPISLAYNTGGIKLNEVSSIVGLGWSLNIPGNIQQNIIGLNDLNSSFFSKNISDYSNYYGLIDVTSATNQIRENIYSILNNQVDTKPDIFNYNLPNKSGSFILNNNDGFTIPNEDIKIKRQGNNKFYLTDNQGVQYWMSPRNSVSSEYIGSTTLDITLYNIDSIKINTKIIKFFYNKYNNYTERNIIEKVNLRMTPLKPGYDGSGPLYKYEKTFSSTSNGEDVISKIVFDDGEVIFQYSDDPNLSFSDGSLYRKDINSQKAIALRRVLVINKAGNIIRDTTLNYDYFESSNINKTYEDYRLKLISVYDNLQKSGYSFIYNEQYKIPKRNSNNDDYWGYINSTYNDETSSNIPNIIRNDYGILLSELNSLNLRDREPNSLYTTLGSLQSIKYPTGAIKKFYYELPYINKKKFEGYGTGGIKIDSLRSGFPVEWGWDTEDSKVFSITQNHYQQAIDKGGFPNKILVSFGNTCKNGENPGDAEEIPHPDGGDGDADLGVCTFSVLFKGRTLGGFREQNVEWPLDEGTGDMSLNRIGNCHCAVDVSLNYIYPIYSDKNIQYSGLRISKIEDVNEDNTTNVFEYLYGKYEDGIFVPKVNLKQPYLFSTINQRFMKSSELVDMGYFEQIFTLHNSSQGNSSYGSSEIATYPYVIEKNNKGSVIMQFDDNGTSYNNYDKWKNGKLDKEILLNATNDTIKAVNYVRNINPIKNATSGFLTNNLTAAGFYTNFDIVPVQTQLGEAYNVDHQTYFIESGKIENTLTTTKEFFQNNIVETKTLSNYYDTDINKPINLKSQTTVFLDQSVSETTYQYAQEKGNTDMLAANMIGIPLETEVKLNNQTISKSGTDYEKKMVDGKEIIVPSKSVSYDLQSLSTPNTEVTYDRYDSFGNLLQYTTKDGISTAIIWGYNNTQPIAKVEGATYAQVENAALGIITASNADAVQQANNDESALLAVLDVFRSLDIMKSTQVTIYTYDPLIGVRSITPPSGIRELYFYDAANRLQYVKDVNGKILKEYQYNYKH